LGIYRLAVGAITQSPPTFTHNAPLVIAPLLNEPLAATDDELLRILRRMVPPTKPVNTNNFVHALRLWGVGAKFEESPLASSRELRDYFLDDRVFQRWNGKNVPPIFERTPNGLRARSFDDSLNNRPTSSYHTDDLLATLGETGTTLDTPIQLRSGDACVRDLADCALRDFTLERHEFEWTIISYARYVFPQKRFKNKFGEVITVDDLVDLCIDQPCGIGPCNGLHRLEALVVLYRADEEAHVLSSATRQKMLQHMANVSRLLVDAQTDAGYWTRNWPRGTAGREDEKATVYDRLLVTGHQLEWLALAPPEVAPPRENIVRAARWTVKTTLELSDKDLQDHYGPFSHAARALCLWRGHEPGEIWQKQP
ncbi:MAG TPA: hypothetical protein VL096_19740, partial [Pirellulaceae bacterium]|nr:hypothetical protein [Pirellulaceae bacterium]